MVIKPTDSGALLLNGTGHCCTLTYKIEDSKKFSWFKNYSDRDGSVTVY